MNPSPLFFNEEIKDLLTDPQLQIPCSADLNHIVEQFIKNETLPSGFNINHFYALIDLCHFYCTKLFLYVIFHMAAKIRFLPIRSKCIPIEIFQALHSMSENMRFNEDWSTIIISENASLLLLAMINQPLGEFRKLDISQIKYPRRNLVSIIVKNNPQLKHFVIYRLKKWFNFLSSRINSLSLKNFDEKSDFTILLRHFTHLKRLEIQSMFDIDFWKLQFFHKLQLLSLASVSELDTLLEAISLHLPHLKILKVGYATEYALIPNKNLPYQLKNLKSFSLGSFGQYFDFDLFSWRSAFKRLTHLRYHGPNLKREIFKNLPFINHLEINSYFRYSIFNSPHQQLRKLNLHDLGTMDFYFFKYFPLLEELSVSQVDFGFFDWIPRLKRLIRLSFDSFCEFLFSILFRAIQRASEVERINFFIHAN